MKTSVAGKMYKISGIFTSSPVLTGFPLTYQHLDSRRYHLFPHPPLHRSLLGL